MSRPKINPNKKRVAVSVSLRPDIIDLAERTENKSRFFEVSVDVAKSLKSLLEDIKEHKINFEDATEELEDLMDVWDAQFDRTVEYSKTGER
jgi:hypothetical protein